MNKKSTILLLIAVVLIGGVVFYGGGSSQTDKPTPTIENTDVPVGYTVDPTEDDVATVTVLDLDQNPVEVDISDWPYYKNDTLNFQFRYPPEYEIFREKRFNATITSNETVLQVVAKKRDEDVPQLEWFMGFDLLDEFEGHKDRLIKEIEGGVLQGTDIKSYFVTEKEVNIWNLKYQGDNPLPSYMSWFEHEDYDVEAELSYHPLSLGNSLSPSVEEKAIIEFQLLLSTFEPIIK